MRLKVFVVFSCFVLVGKIVQAQDDRPCGYESCTAGHPDRLNVHLVSHSHDDTGWLKTVDQYYTGQHEPSVPIDEWSTRAGVQYILDTVVRELAFNPERKFIQVETAFFWRWWTEQEQPIKDLVHELVDSGQFEFISGGWCMNDEATAHYVAIIDQMSLGMKKLRETFGHCGVPRAAWQIDPFGHSKEQADLFVNMGMDGLLFGRLDYREKDQRFANNTGEMIWKTSTAGNKLFTGILYNLYVSPDGFCWDASCQDEPLMDNPKLHDYNINVRSQEFVKFIRQQKKSYVGNNILVTLGMDFQYQLAHTWFKNIDKLISYVNSELGEKEKIHLMYSTPSCYIKALNEEAIDWPTKSDDFFPYASDSHTYWTGYFSSRPNSKRMIRETSGWLQFAKHLSVSKLISENPQAGAMLEAVEELSRAVAVSQHHDAVTGTEKQHVANDYHRRLHKGMSHFMETVDSSYCPLLNISQCHFTDDQFDLVNMVIYNNLGHKRSSVVHVPVKSGSGYTVTDDEGNDVEVQITPLPNEVKNIPGRDSLAEFNLAFSAQNIRPLNTKTYTITGSTANQHKYESKVLKAGNSFKVKTDRGDFKVTIREKEFSFYNPVTRASVTHQFGFYKGYPGSNTGSSQRASGAYIFRPLEQEPSILAIKNSTLFEGPLHSELQLSYDNSASLIFRIPTNPSLYDAEYEWLVGPINVDDGVGKEYISRWKVDGTFEQEGLFYTDANGRQTMERKRDVRPSYDIGNSTFEEPVSSNYYPVNSAIFIKDVSNQVQLTVVNDRAQGGSSLRDGEIELMLHRRLLFDDAFGVEEALNEEAYGAGLVARGKHYVTLDTNFEEGNAKRRQLSNEIFGHHIHIFPYEPSSNILKPLWNQNSFQDDGDYPINVNFLSVEPWLNPNSNATQYLIRIEHLFEEGEHSLLSQPVTVNLLQQFPPISFIRETLLGANQWVVEKKALQWRLRGDGEQEPEASADLEKEIDVENIILEPMQIRTFIVEFF